MKEQTDYQEEIKADQNAERCANGVDTTTTPSVDLNESLLRTSSSEGGSEGFSDKPSRPSASFVALITEAINSTPEKQMVLSEIYSYIEEHYKYFKTASPGWKVSIP